MIVGGIEDLTHDPPNWDNCVYSGYGGGCASDGDTGFWAKEAFDYSNRDIKYGHYREGYTY